VSGREVVVCATGTANLASVFAGLKRAGGAPRMATSPDDITAAGHVMLPGVGSFGAAMAALDASGMTGALRARIVLGRPTLSICVGLQLFCRSSEESPGATGLGIVDAAVTRFPETVRVPQFGWNDLTAGEGCAVVRNGFAYFANSYRLTEPPAGWAVATADHGGPFVAAMEKGAVVACQFHPELSGAYGHALLSSWIALPC
jgi:glutamine amidotransferase